jgi:predicted GIY-YIG superfamily endonuclease
MKDHIVYRIVFPNDKHYIGVTSQTIEKRLAQHRCAKTAIGNALRKHSEFKVETVTTGSSAKCYAVEEMLANYNRAVSYNIALGGGGGGLDRLLVGNPKKLARIKKKNGARIRKLTEKNWRDPEFRKKNAERLGKMWRDPEFISATVERLRKVNDDPAIKKAKGERMSKMNTTCEAAARSSKRMRDLWANNEERAARISSLTKAQRCPEMNARRRKSLAKANATPQVRARRQAAARALWANPEFRAKQVAKALAREALKRAKRNAA